MAQIVTARTGHRRHYGQRRTWRELTDAGVQVGRDRVARLMGQAGMVGVRRGVRHTTTIQDHRVAERADDRVERDFTATGPNRLWVADFTYLRTLGGFIYLAFVLDVYSRMIVGWLLASHRRAELVTDALDMALALRRPAPVNRPGFLGVFIVWKRGWTHAKRNHTGEGDHPSLQPRGESGRGADGAHPAGRAGHRSRHGAAGR